MINKRAKCVFLFLLVAPVALSADLPESSTRASAFVRYALDAMGGEQKLRAVESVKFTAIGHRNELEQSERPEGPYIVEYDRVSEIRNFRTNSLRRSVEAKIATQPKFETVMTVSGDAATMSSAGNLRPGSPGQVSEAIQELALGPERVLLNALAATDLRTEPDTQLQSVQHHVIAFKWQTIPVRIFLNADTGLPTAIEWISANPFDGFWRTWGDVTTRVYYSFWWLASGIHYPLQWNTEKNGLPDHAWTIDELEINPSLASDTFEIRDGDRAAYQKNASIQAQGLQAEFDTRPLAVGLEFFPGIVHFPGAWNTTLVQQVDGIVVLEAPISAGYSQRVLAESQRRFPGLPIKAVISTSDSWPHFSGLREYVALGIPIYILDLNCPILQRFVASPRTFYPDALAKSPRKPNFRMVTAKTTLGSGPNRLEIYPLRGETSERQMMVYFPEYRVLYGSDPFQRLDEKTYFYPQTVWEVVHAVEREKITVEKFFMMHVGLTSWSELPAALREADMKDPVAAIQGEWKVMALEMDGVSLDPVVFAGSKIVIEGNEFTSLGMGAQYRGTIELQDSGQPKTFHMRFTEGPEKGNTNYGIYELSGNSWKICLSTKGGPAPRTFATVSGSGFALEELKRQVSRP